MGLDIDERLLSFDFGKAQARSEATQRRVDPGAVVVARNDSGGTRTPGQVAHTRKLDGRQSRSPKHAQARHLVAHFAIVGAVRNRQSLDAALRARQLPDDASKQSRSHSGTPYFGVLEQPEEAIA
jgi:hypothetical protein